MLVGARVAASLAIGACVAWIIGRGDGGAFSSLMWPAAALMIAGGVTSTALRAGRIVESVRAIVRSGARVRVGLVALVLPIACAVAVLCIVNRAATCIPIWITLASVAVSLPLLVVGTRVLGETNWAPVAALAAVAQAVLAPLWPGCLVVTMVGSTVAGAIPNGGQHMMQSLRAAQVVGARARDTVIAQLIGVLVGALGLAITYPMLAARFGVGESGLWSPFSAAWAGFAEALAGSAIPRGAIVMAIVGGAVGVLLALVEKRFGSRAPSPTAIGMGMLLPAPIVIAVGAGCAIERIAARVAPRAANAHRVPVAAGLVAGEAIAACVAAALTRV
jgi:hypothetical protein